MKLVQVAEANKKYYSKEFIHGFNTGAKTQLEADKKEAERRGRWIDNEFGTYCSNCGVYAYRSQEIPWKSIYCPFCGADMREAKNGCDDCFIPMFYNLEDDDSICRDCGVGE